MGIYKKCHCLVCATKVYHDVSVTAAHCLVRATTIYLGENDITTTHDCLRQYNAGNCWVHEKAIWHNKGICLLQGTFEKTSFWMINSLA